MARRKTIIWPDKDRAGIEFAANVFKKLIETGEAAPNIKAVDVEKLDLKEKEDVDAWIERGQGRKDILNLPFKEVYTLQKI